LPFENAAFLKKEREKRNNERKCYSEKLLKMNRKKLRFIQRGDSASYRGRNVDRTGTAPYNEINQEIRFKIQHTIIRSVAGIATPFQYNSSPKSKNRCKPVFAFFTSMQ
jgi:hypothetical protein